MTSPIRWSFRARYLLGFLVCAALLAYALYTQFAQRLTPCNFCILQRIAFAVLGLVLLIGGLHAPRRPQLRKVYGMLAGIAALAGAGIALRHYWVQLFPPPMPQCGAQMDFLLQMMSVSDMLKKVLFASGDCSAIDWKFLGLTMPAWCAIWFAGLGLWAVHAAWTRRDPTLRTLRG